MAVGICAAEIQTIFVLQKLASTACRKGTYKNIEHETRFEIV